MNAPAEVRDLELPAVADEEVLRLDVAVDHVLRVAVAEGAGELEDVLGALALAETTLGLEVLVELAAGAVL